MMLHFYKTPTIPTTLKRRIVLVGGVERAVAARRRIRTI
jgi:hypothetical protein